MFCLTRRPKDPLSQELNLSRTSIFSSDYGLVQDISFFITDEQEHDQGHDTQQNNNIGLQWFAYENKPMEFHAVSVPRRTQIISVFPSYFLSARMMHPPPGLKREPYAKLCIYARKYSKFVDVPSYMESAKGQSRDLLSAACAILDGWLYVAGGYMADSSNDAEAKPSTPLDTAERLNLVTLKWHKLPTMCKPQAYSTGIAHMKEFIVLGDENNGHSAQIYSPRQMQWDLCSQFIPQEANGYAARSFNGSMLLLTWSDSRGIKIWALKSTSYVPGSYQWILLHFYTDNKVEKIRFSQNGAKLVVIRNEVFIFVEMWLKFTHMDYYAFALLQLLLAKSIFASPFNASYT